MWIKKEIAIVVKVLAILHKIVKNGELWAKEGK